MLDVGSVAVVRFKPRDCHQNERFGRAALLARARDILRVRVEREMLLGRALFRDPAWDMLLDLFIAYLCDEKLSVSAVCVGSRGSSATALRHIALLQYENLVEREPDVADARRFYLRLTVLGQRKMIAIVSLACERLIPSGVET